MRHASWLLLLGLAGCTVQGAPIDGGRDLPDVAIPPPPPDATIDADVADAEVDAWVRPDTGPRDATVDLDPDAACAAASAPVVIERVPVDIIWVVDNSGSMRPARQQVRDGLNAFAAQIAASDLDYRVILLSRRGTGNEQVCIPPPLGGANCADGDRFFHVSVDIKSTQPVEQFLGTLGQTVGYTADRDIGSEPWRHLLREGAAKTIVFVTDDNARTCERPHSGGRCSVSGASPLTELSLENFPGGLNPFNSARGLGPGILTPTYGTLFENYTLSAIYGWGSETDPSIACSFSSSTDAANPGWTYTTLVARTGGVRAKICDGAAAWGPFFDDVASDVVRNAPIACELAIPAPPDGSLLNPRQVNVVVRGASGETTIPFTTSSDACDPTRGGWHYDRETNPTTVILCPTSCDFAREQTATTDGGLDVRFGCDQILI